MHGGVIAMVFDEMLGAANIMAGSPGMTGTLTIKYRKPTPLRTPLRLEARFVGRDGRKIRTYGAMYHGDVLTAEAEGIFIELVPQRFLGVVTENADSPEAVEQVRADARRLGFVDAGRADGSGLHRTGSSRRGSVRRASGRRLGPGASGRPRRLVGCPDPVA